MPSFGSTLKALLKLVWNALNVSAYADIPVTFTNKNGQVGLALRWLPLRDGALKAVSGMVKYLPEFREAEVQAKRSNASNSEVFTALKSAPSSTPADPHPRLWLRPQAVLHR
jgi:hypothetical protein